MRYILFKQSAIQIDAIEAAAQGHLARARARNKDRTELSISVLEGLPSQAKAADAKDAETKAAEVKTVDTKAAIQQHDSTINTNATSSAFLHQKKKMGVDVSEGFYYYFVMLYFMAYMLKFLL